MTSTSFDHIKRVGVDDSDIDDDVIGVKKVDIAVILSFVRGRELLTALFGRHFSVHE